MQPAPNQPAPAPLNPDYLTLGSIEVKLRDGRSIPFQFPDSGNMRQNLASILQGREYTGLPLPGYKPAVIIDIGANVGATALYFHGIFPGAMIYCFEASPTNAGFLKRNLAPIERARAFDYGLSDRDQQVQLHIGKTQFMQNSIVPNLETQARTETAQLRRASTEFQRLGINEISLLKLDTEGWEMPILRDMVEWLARTDLAYVEYHSEEDRQAIEDLFRSTHILGRANSNMPHRGTNLYVSRALTAKHPALGQNRIGPAK